MRIVAKILVAACSLLVVLGGCTPSDTSTLRLVLGETVIYPHNEPPFIQVKRGDEIITISDEEQYPSPPEISPDRSKLVYISPYEFEMNGYVWIYDASTGAHDKITPPNQSESGDQSVRRVIWLDDDHLLILTGYIWGTIPSARTLFVYNLEAKTFREVYQAEETESIREIELAGDEVHLLIDPEPLDMADHNFTTEILELASLLD